MDLHIKREIQKYREDQEVAVLRYAILGWIVPFFLFLFGWYYLAATLFVLSVLFLRDKID